MKSPNFTKGTRPKIGFIIHGTLGKYEGAIDWLCTPPEKRPTLTYSSAHYVVAKDGRVAQLVDDKDVSWHAGNVSHPTKSAAAVLPMANGKFMNPNESFIGIELEWFLGDKVTDQQFSKVVEIVKKGGIQSPILLCHKEVADYKPDFQTSTGEIDMTIVAEIKKRLYDPVKTVIEDTVTPLLTKLNSQVANKDYKGARDTTSFLFNELSKLK